MDNRDFRRFGLAMTISPETEAILRDLAKRPAHQDKITAAANTGWGPDE